MRYILFIAILMVAGKLAGQPLQLTLMMNPTPSPYLSDWQTRHETVFLSINNTTQNTFQVRVDGKVYRGGTGGELMAQSKLPQMDVLTIPP
jgi:hypothetical protein